MRLGRAAHDPEQLAKVYSLATAIDDDVIPEPAEDVGCGRFMTSTPLLGNDEAGDCVVVTICHFIQAVTAAMGRERTFTRAEALAIYRELSGWDGSPETDTGLNMYAVLTRWMKDSGLFGGVKLWGIASIDLKDWRRVQQGVQFFGGVLCGWDLPLVSQHQVKWRVEMGAGDEKIKRGGWGGHATFGGDRVLVPGGRPLLKVRTWGGEKDTTSSYSDGYGAEGYIGVIDGWEPPDVPGFDRDRLMRALKELSR